jgi:hypothetical protein
LAYRVYQYNKNVGTFSIIKLIVLNLNAAPMELHGGTAKRKAKLLKYLTLDLPIRFSFPDEDPLHPETTHS